MIKKQHNIIDTDYRKQSEALDYLAEKGVENLTPADLRLKDELEAAIRREIAEVFDGDNGVYQLRQTPLPSKPSR